MKDNYLKIVLLALIAVVAIQGYYIYDVNRSLKDKQVSLDVKESLMIPKLRPFDGFFNENEDSFKEMERLRRGIENSFMDFENFFQITPFFERFSSKLYRTPRFDMKDHDGKYIITMEVPGIDKSEIDIKTQDGQLIVSAKLSQEKDNNTTTYYRHERRISSYKRVITLPTNADETSMHSDYKDGLLRITFDKKIP